MTEPESSLDPFLVPPEYLHAIGLVASQFSLAEMLLESCILGLAKVEHDGGPALTTHMPTPLRLSVFRSLAGWTLNDQPRLLREANDLAAEFQRVSSLRADIVHAVWFYDPSDGTVHAGKTVARKVLKSSLDQKTINEIQGIVDQIRTLQRRLKRFVMLAFRWLGPLPPGKTDADLTRQIDLYWRALRAEQDRSP